VRQQLVVRLGAFSTRWPLLVIRHHSFPCPLGLPNDAHEPTGIGTLSCKEMSCVLPILQAAFRTDVAPEV